MTFVGTFHILSDTYMYITYLLIIIYDKDSHKLFIKKKRMVIMHKDFLAGMNTHPHTEDQADQV